MPDIKKQFFFYEISIKSFKKSLKIPKEVIRSHKSKNDRQHNGLKKKDIQRSTKHYIENSRSNNKNSTKNQGYTQVLRKGNLYI